MTPLLILTHGEHGAAMLKAAEGMLGPQAQALALSLGVDETREAFAERTAQAMASLPSMPLALVDVACGTPWNVAVMAGCATRSDVLAGLSLPLLLEALTLRESLGPAELAAELKKRAPQVLQRAVELLARPSEGA
jgi:fructose-specific PTS system IIA component